MIQVTPEQITFTVQESLFDQTFSVLEQTGLPFKGEGFCQSCHCGWGDSGVPGVMARVVEGLYKAQVPLFQTADSHTNIACLVKKEDMINALVLCMRSLA